MKLVRQSEVYLMEEAVTDQILKSGGNANHHHHHEDSSTPNVHHSDEHYIAEVGINFSELEKENTTDVINKLNGASSRYLKEKPDIIDIKTLS